MRSLPWFVCAAILAAVASAACRWRKPGMSPSALPSALSSAAERGPGPQGRVSSQAPEDKAAPAIGEYTRSLLVGFLHDARSTLNVSTLATGVGPRTQAAVLATDWHIHTAGEARGTLAWLLEEGHRALYPQVCRILFSVPRAAREREIVLLDDRFDPVRLARCIDNLERAMPDLRASRLLGSRVDLARGVLAWDMSRAIHVARAAYDCGMQTEAQAWAVIEQAASQVFAQMASWQEVAVSHLLGRAMWAGPGAGLQRQLAFVRHCLDDSDSPMRGVRYHAARRGV